MVRDRGDESGIGHATRLKGTWADAVQRFFEEYVSQLERPIREDDLVWFLREPINGMGVEGKRTFNSQYIKDEQGRLLRKYALFRKGWVRWFHKFLNTKSPTLDPTIVGEHKT